MRQTRQTLLLLATVALAALVLARQPRKDSFGALFTRISTAARTAGTAGARAVLTASLNSLEQALSLVADITQAVSKGLMKAADAVAAVKASRLSPVHQNTLINRLGFGKDAVKASEQVTSAATAAGKNLMQNAPEFAFLNRMADKYAGNPSGFVSALKTEVRQGILNAFKKQGMSDADALKALQKEGMNPGSVEKMRSLAGSSPDAVDDLFASLKLSKNGAPLTFAERWSWVAKYATTAAGVGVGAFFIAVELKQLVDSETSSGGGAGGAGGAGGGGGSIDSTTSLWIFVGVVGAAACVCCVVSGVVAYQASKQ